VFFLGWKLGAKEENKNKMYQPENEHVPAKKGHFKRTNSEFTPEFFWFEDEISLWDPAGVQVRTANVSGRVLIPTLS